MDKNKTLNKDKIIYLDDYVRIPDDYESDIFVDLDYTIDWEKIYKKRGKIIPLF